MGHPPRIFTPDLSLHVIRRGVNRGAVFDDDADRHHFLYDLQDAAEDHHVSVHGFVMMTTHYHLLVTPKEELSLRCMMKTVGEEYVTLQPQARSHWDALGGPLSRDRY
jgi:putative transposase